MITADQIVRWLGATEDEHVEFKEAKNHFDQAKLCKYCSAFSNEGGGRLVLGISPKIPRTVVGSQAIGDINNKKLELLQTMNMRVEIFEQSFEGKRIVILDIPPRSPGQPVHYKGAYWMRSGESLVPMTADRLKKIFDKESQDFSAETCPRATITDLDPDAITELRERWHSKSRNDGLLNITDHQLLSDAELVRDGQVTIAGLVLLGTPAALAQYLPQSEIIFEYRSSETSTEHQQRIEFRRGFFLCHNSLWEAVNLRNTVEHYQDGLFVWDIPTFNERVVREAILNAVSHRDYRSQGSVVIKQYPKKMEIISPGGFPNGITAENILDKQLPRNRRIAEALQKCGFVERAG